MSNEALSVCEGSSNNKRKENLQQQGSVRLLKSSRSSLSDMVTLYSLAAISTSDSFKRSKLGCRWSNGDEISSECVG